MANTENNHQITSKHIVNSRYWVAVLWKENLVDGWEEKAEDLLQIPFAYCVHNLDVDSKSEHRKNHIHMVLAFPNTTTYNHALNVFKQLGEKAVNTCQSCIGVRYCYDYLIHDTKTCKKLGKHLYDPKDRVLGNNFDIGMYEQITLQQKHEMLKDLVQTIDEKQFMTINEFTQYVFQNFTPDYWDIIISFNAILERYCAGNYKKMMRLCGKMVAGTTENNLQMYQQNGVPICPYCGSVDVKKNGKRQVKGGFKQRYACLECNKTFVD